MLYSCVSVGIQSVSSRTASGTSITSLGDSDPRHKVSDFIFNSLCIDVDCIAFVFYVESIFARRQLIAAETKSMPIATSSADQEVEGWLNLFTYYLYVIHTICLREYNVYVCNAILFALYVWNFYRNCGWFDKSLMYYFNLKRCS
jgi:hypothetical protein